MQRSQGGFRGLAAWVVPQALLQDIKRTFGTPHGKRVLYYLLDEGKQFQSVFAEGKKIYWLSGVQDYCRVVIIQKIMEADPSLYFDVVQMMVSARKVPYNASVSDS